MSKISVCMIVKNEEKVLARCLKCVKKFADEIIIVDTGSTDNTIKIAKKFTDKVYNFKWQDDFAKARNYSLQFASCEYIMWIDADDIITNSNIKKILELKKNLTAETYMLKYQINFDKNRRVTFEYYRERIIKNCASAKFKGFVHECITPFGRIEFVDIALQHKKIEKTRDNKRNLKLYQKNIKNGIKLNTRETFYYAKELFYNKFYSKTIIALKQFLKMQDKFLPNTLDAYLTLSDCYLFLKQNKKAKDTLIECLKNILPSANICCKLGYLYVLDKNYSFAIFWYKCALNLTLDAKTGSFIERDYYDFIPYLQLSYCYYNLGDIKNFKKYHNLAKKIKPNHSVIVNNQKYIDENNI